jgi:hypothetical protein
VLNPTGAAAAVALPPASTGAGALDDVYDSVAQSWVARGLPDSDPVVLTLSPQQAAVIVRVPAGAAEEKRGRLLYAGGRVIDFAAA